MGGWARLAVPGDRQRMSGMALGGAAVLQLLAGVVRVRAWFHVIRRSRTP
jgi:hypothetical protein